jgi:hypothetical protein
MQEMKKSENLKKKFMEKPKNAKFLFLKKFKCGVGLHFLGAL